MGSGPLSSVRDLRGLLRCQCPGHHGEEAKFKGAQCSLSVSEDSGSFCRLSL